MWYRWLAVLMAALLFAGCGSDDDDDRPLPPSIGTLDYLALGGSDAVGIGAFPLKDGYVFLIAETLENERVQPVGLANFGVPGAEADDVLNALNLALATSVRPDLVTLWTGVNDLTRGRTPAAFAADLEAILALLGQTDALVFLGDLPDLTTLPRFIAEPDPDVTLERVAAFNAVIEEQAARHGASVVRLSALPVDAELTSPLDGFHPSNAGHAAIADAFLQVILPALGLRP